MTIFDIFFFSSQLKALLFLFLCYTAIYTRSFVRLTLSFFRFCFRRISGNTCCRRICIQARRFTNATFAKGTIRNHFERISRKNFAHICWKCTVTRFRRLATRTTTLSGFLKSIGARISSTSRINRFRSFRFPDGTLEIYDGTCVLKLVKGDPQRFTSAHRGNIFQIYLSDRRLLAGVSLNYPRCTRHSARMRVSPGRCCCSLSLFAIVRTGRPVPRQEIVKVMYGHVARYVSTLDAYTIESLYPFEFWDIMRIVRVHPP